jgi:hypothetical protein
MNDRLNLRMGESHHTQQLLYLFNIKLCLLGYLKGYILFRGRARVRIHAVNVCRSFPYLDRQAALKIKIFRMMTNIRPRIFRITTS